MKNICKKLAIVLSVICLVFAFCSCGYEKQASDYDYEAEKIYDASEESVDSLSGKTEFKLYSSDSASEEVSDSEATETATTTEEKYVITASLTLETKTFDEDLETIKTKIAELSGYTEQVTVSGKEYETYTTQEATIVARVFEEKYEEFLTFLGETCEVLYQEENKENITENYIKAESYVEALDTSETRLLALLESAENVETILQIETKLAETRQQIRYYEELLSSYDNSVEYTTVTIKLNGVKEYTELQKETFATRIFNSSNTGWSNFVENCKDFAVWFVGALPTFVVLAVIGLAIYLTIRGIIKSAKRKKTRKEFFERQVAAQNARFAQNAQKQAAQQQRPATNPQVTTQQRPVTNQQVKTQQKPVQKPVAKVQEPEDLPEEEEIYEEEEFDEEEIEIEEIPEEVEEEVVKPKKTTATKATTAGKAPTKSTSATKKTTTTRTKKTEE